MSAAAVLRRARQAGLHLEAEAGDLVVEVDGPLPEDLIGLLREHKPEIIRLLRREQGARTAEDWRDRFEERAGIAEYDGGLSREKAEAQAFEGCVAEWLDQNPVRSSPDWCLVCGRPDEMGEPLLPVGVEPGGPAWLHPDCWERWYAGRREQAVAALEAVGIIERRTLS